MENVYIVETYKECYKNKDGTYKLKNTLITDDNIENLYKDHGYHYEIDPNKDCCVFGDIDKCLNKRLLFKLLSKIQKLYDVSDDEFIHTLGEKKENGKHYYGSHWVIPSIKTNTKSIKLHLKELNEKYGDVIDLSVYKAGLLRLPYQTTKEKPYRHTLPYRNKDAEIKHFLIHNTIDCDIELYEDDSDNSKYNSITQNLGDVIPSTKLNYEIFYEKFKLSL